MSRGWRCVGAALFVGALTAGCGAANADADARADDAAVPSGDTVETPRGTDVDPAPRIVRRDLGSALRPESDVVDNPLPALQVHDVGQDQMVEFRNIFPAERPVLLWMWAPY